MRNTFKTTPPDDSLSNDFTSCSEWCRKMWEETFDDAYIKMYELWQSRGQ